MLMLILHFTGSSSRDTDADVETYIDADVAPEAAQERGRGATRCLCRPLSTQLLPLYPMLLLPLLHADKGDANFHASMFFAFFLRGDSGDDIGDDILDDCDSYTMLHRSRPQVIVERVQRWRHKLLIQRDTIAGAPFLGVLSLFEICGW